MSVWSYNVVTWCHVTKWKSFISNFARPFHKTCTNLKPLVELPSHKWKSLSGGAIISMVCGDLVFWLGHLSNYRNRLRQLLIRYIVNGVNCVQLILIADWFKLHSLLVHVTNIIKLASKIWILELRDWGKNRSTQIFPFTFPWHWKYKLDYLWR